jgi:hypothetical protein
MNSASRIENINSKSDFLSFLDEFRKEAVSGDTWQNRDLGDFLEAMSAFLNDINENSVYKIDNKPSWKMFAQIMTAASVYE